MENSEMMRCFEEYIALGVSSRIMRHPIRLVHIMCYKKSFIEFILI